MSAAAPETRQPNFDAEVIIIGAGVAGLCAARELDRRQVSCLLLEARDRVGGRTLSQRLGRDVVDLGGQWIGPKQNRLATLAKELGVATFPQYCTGKKVLWWKGKRHAYAGDLPRFSLLSQLELLWADRRFKRFAAKIPPDRPWDAPRADEWDGQTLETWKRRNLHTAGSRLFLDVVTRALLTSEPRDVSLLFFLSYLRWGQGLEQLISITGGAQESRFVGGAQQIAERLAEPLGPRLLLNAPIRAVQQDTDGVTVRSDGRSWRARRLIVAVPPLLAGRIYYTHPLPDRRDQLTARMPMGSVIKYVATYPRAFWREAGFSGEAVSDTGATVTTFDDTSHDGSQAALVSFSDGDAARHWGARPADERRQAVLGELARYFGPAALRPTDFVEKNWNADPWSAGCYVGVMPPGTMTRFGQALREPCGRIHWSGTETATEWMGYIEGAIQSGYRAADEVCQRLGVTLP